jgi:hypothetical protein
MADQSVGQRGVPASASRFGVLGSIGVRELQPRVAWTAAGLVLVSVADYFWWHEGWWANMLFTLFTTLALVAVLVAVSRRVLFATIAVATLVALIVIASSVKRQLMDMVVHAYDLVFYLASWSTLAYLWSDHRQYVIWIVAGLLVAMAVGWIAFRLDGTRVPRREAAVAALAFALVASLAASWKGERRNTLFYWEDLYVSSFYSSWRETIETLWRGQIIEALDGAHGGPLFTLPPSCGLAQKPPHIILIHQESIVQPSLFAGLEYDKSLDPFFHSHDGKLHRLRVETYGGASWLTEFSILAGVSTHSFGGMRQFVQSVMAGKLRDTMPEALARCGYRNVVFYPMMRNFVSNAKFYTAVGMPEIFDYKDQGAKRFDERDRFYYENGLKLMDRHIRLSRRPLFTFILTMAAHSPYDDRYEPQVDVPGGGPGTHPEMHEYLRRLGMARMDYDYLRSELQRRYPDERFLIVQYGDHQPMATRTMLGYTDAYDPEDMLMPIDSPGFITYFAVDGQNYRPPPLPDVETLDVPYLGTLILDAAGLPLSDAARERMRLLTLCGGRYYGCQKREEILGFHRRLIDSGLIEAR